MQLPIKGIYVRYFFFKYPARYSENHLDWKMWQRLHYEFITLSAPGPAFDLFECFRDKSNEYWKIIFIIVVEEFSEIDKWNCMCVCV